MYHVYILRSLKYPEKTYVGYTSLTPLKRLFYHNNGYSKYTNYIRPLEVIWHCSFEDIEKAKAFEKYLKSGSGIAFRNKRLI